MGGASVRRYNELAVGAISAPLHFFSLDSIFFPLYSSCRKENRDEGTH